MADQQNLNIPQLLAFLLISGFAIRWLFFSPSSSRSSAGPQDSRYPGGRRVDEARVEQVQSMFPQLGRREIIWDLMRNGGSVAATTEKILNGQRLDTPPPSFQPPPPTPPPSLNPPSTPQSTPATQKPAHPDLITRYNLSSKISSGAESFAGEPSSAEDSAANGTAAEKGGWSQNKNERQALMKRRREEMILQARRRMETKDKGKAVVR
ncbi:MAG: hypothetical protein M4579_001248 [Chaenotheca gracillima]|nr:MAG: hypothetical protein M4579_001248 [Chaenotheca gracillima]